MAMSKMSDFDKGYLLGMGEAMVSQKQDDKKKKEGELHEHVQELRMP